MLGKTDPAWKFGCGRYIQERNALERLPQEIARLGRKPMVMAGSKGLEALMDCRPDAMAGVTGRIERYSGACTMEAASEFAEMARMEHADVIIGIGGGKMMDLAKLAAKNAGLPVIMVPTITATCAAYTPLSVMYDKEGRTTGSWFHETEVDCVIADTELLSRQPVRYVAAGILDSMAKSCEIAHHAQKSFAGTDMTIAYELAQRLFERLNDLFDRVMNDVAQGSWSENVEEMVFLTIPVTGMISGTAKGSFQSAVGHAFYEEMRYLYPQKAAPYLHGELVGLGLKYQTAYTGIHSREIKAILSKTSIPQGLPEMGVTKTECGALAEGMEARMKKDGKQIALFRLWSLMNRDFENQAAHSSISEKERRTV